jgi:hypothetical protein
MKIKIVAMDCFPIPFKAPNIELPKEWTVTNKPIHFKFADTVLNNYWSVVNKDATYSLYKTIKLEQIIHRMNAYVVMSTWKTFAFPGFPSPKLFPINTADVT